MANAFYVGDQFGEIIAVYDAPTGLITLDLGAVKVGGVQISITGMAWDPVGGKLYAVTRTVDAFHPKSLLEIDPADPTNSTLIGALGTAHSCTDITCSASGQLFGYTAGTNGRLVSINKTTGVASNVGGLGPDFSGGIAFVGSTCYYIPASLGSAIYTVNTSTGVFTDTGIVHTVSPFGVEALEDHDGVVYGGGANNYYADINLATGVGAGVSFVTVPMSDLQALASVPIPPAPPLPGPPPIPKPVNTNVAVAFPSTALEEVPFFIQIDDPNANPIHPEQSIDVVSGFRIDRGRASEFDKTGTGTAVIDLVDVKGYVDPTNPSGPFYGQLDPMKQVQILLRNPVTGFDYSIFRGFASEWTYDVDVSGAFTRATLDCADAFDLLSALEMTPGHHGDTGVPAQSLGDIFFKQGPPGNLDVADNGPSRIHKALDDAGWGPDLREVFTGNVILQETIYARRDQLLSVIFDAADAEFPGVANVYMNKYGYVTFHGRYARFNPTDPQYGIQFWKAGTGPIAATDAGMAPISGLRFRRSKSDIINAAMSVPQLRVGEWTPAELATMIEKDDDSIAKYGWRSDSYDNLLTLKGRVSPDSPTNFPLDAIEQTKLYSQWRVKNYKDPHTRVEQITFRPQDPGHFSGPATWSLMTQIEIGDVVNLHTHHPGGGGFDNEDFFVEGIHYDVQPGPEAWPDVTLTIDVSPRSLYQFNPFALHDPPTPSQPAAIGPLSIIGGQIGQNTK